MARPKKDADLVRPHRITFRLTDVEYEIVKKRCEGAGRLFEHDAFTMKPVIDASWNIP